MRNPSQAAVRAANVRPGRKGAIGEILAFSALALCLVGGPTLAFAEDSCSMQAMDKKLAGAAKTSFMTKCARDSCGKMAADKNLHGAAMTSFTKKCEKDAMGG